MKYRPDRWNTGHLATLHATWHTRVSQTIRRWKLPNSLLNFLQLALSSDLVAASGSLLMHSSTEAFIYAKIKHSACKTFLSSVRWGGNVDKRKASWWFLFVFRIRSKTTHIASSLFCDRCFSAAQIARISILALAVAALDNHLVLHAPCNCRLFVFIIVWSVIYAWCMARQGDRSGETVKHFHNCIKIAFTVSYTILHRSAAVWAIFLHYSNRRKGGGAYDNAQMA